MSIAPIDLPFRAHVSARATASETIDLSIVVPTFNESKNIRELIARLERALPDIRWELVFVDDNSADGTHRLVREIARRDPRVRCLQRIGRRGLSSACIEGIFATAAPTIAVMDADLQHDEKILPSLYEQIRENGADVAIGTRYSAGGSTGQWDKRRVSFSRMATRASNVVLKQKVSDPMSGFFMLRREVVENCVTDLSAVGFKILLDILASTRTPLKIAEVPYTFRDRFAGESKLDEMVVWEYAMLLADKTIGRFMPVRFVMFSLIGGLGVFVHLAILTVLLNVLSLGFTLGQSIATCAAMVFNFAINNVLTYRDRRLRGASWFKGLLTFMAACSIGALANVGIARYLFVNETQWILAALAGVMVGAVWNYAVTQLYTWTKKS